MIVLSRATRNKARKMLIMTDQNLRLLGWNRRSASLSSGGRKGLEGCAGAGAALSTFSISRTMVNGGDPVYFAVVPEVRREESIMMN